MQQRGQGIATCAGRSDICARLLPGRAPWMPPMSANRAMSAILTTSWLLLRRTCWQGAEVCGRAGCRFSAAPSCAGRPRRGAADGAMRAGCGPSDPTQPPITAPTGPCGPRARLARASRQITGPRAQASPAPPRTWRTLWKGCSVTQRPQQARCAVTSQRLSCDSRWGAAACLGQGLKKSSCLTKSWKSCNSQQAAMAAQVTRGCGGRPRECAWVGGLRRLIEAG